MPYMILFLQSFPKQKPYYGCGLQNTLDCLKDFVGWTHPCPSGIQEDIRKKYAFKPWDYQYNEAFRLHGLSCR